MTDDLTKTDPGIACFGYEELHRGGYIVSSPIGLIQFGVPPETIKDTMRTEKGVPRIFVLMERTFDWIKGISLAEIEFPIYYNFFIKKRKTIILCERNQVARTIAMLGEAVFGPSDPDVSGDYPEFACEHCVPVLRDEMAYFRNGLSLTDLVAFATFVDDRITIHDVSVLKNRDKTFTVLSESGPIARIPGSFDYKSAVVIGERLNAPYEPPVYGVTCLGPSHGFDPDQNTSGFIIWLNRYGIMVDPPVNSTEWLERSNVNPKLIDGIILTHCHADHDAGTFQKILEEGRITIYSTDTVINSFLRKYSALSGKKAAFLRKLFDFHPVRIGQPLFVHGGKFVMFYTLHSIPTFGFRMVFQNQTFVYSSDHNNDPDIHAALLEKGVISKERHAEFAAFPWDSRVIYHESGIAPLHTPIAYLDSLDEDIKKRMIVYHIARKDFPADTSMRLAKFGIENTLVFPTERAHYDSTYAVLEILKHLDFLNHLDISKAQEFLLMAKEEHFTAGQTIIERGSIGDKFYVIHLGTVSVLNADLQQKKMYGSYEYFGETALLTDSPRTADVLAETDVVAYSLARDEFLSFIAGTEFERTLLHVLRARSPETWNLLSTSRYFGLCSSYQKTWLESILVPEIRDVAGVIIAQGQALDRIYLISEGIVTVFHDTVEIAQLGPGDFIGAMYKIAGTGIADYEFRNAGPVRLFVMNKDELLPFIQNNPGIVMKLMYDF